MRAYFKLFNQFIARALRSSPLRSAVTALGISLGVGVMVAIRLANTSALESFRAATDAVAGETSIRITGAAGRFDELMLGELLWLRQYGQMSPVITGFALMGGADEFLQVLGVDVLRDRSLRRYRLLSFGDERREPTSREFLHLLTDPQSIILTEKFARRYGLSIGGAVSMVFANSERDLIVRGLLRDEGPARALDGNFALMDIAAAQAAFDRAGLLDRLDVKLKDGIALDQAESEIAERLPPALKLERPEAAYGQVEKMIAAFHFNLNALASIALLVGLFLIYNTISISVITRREEIGALRAVGVGRRLVLALFLGEAVILALAGTIAGLGLGRVMAAAAVRATAATVETFYIASTATGSVGGYSLSSLEALMAFAVALPLSLIAAAIPALEASRVRPVEAIRGAERLARNIRPSARYLWISLVLLASGYGFSLIGPVGGLPVFGYVSALALMFGGAFLVPNALWLVCTTRLFKSLGVEARLASANLRGAISRVSISVAALAMSLAMMVAISIMIGSFRETVSYWVDQTLKADIYARPLARIDTGGDGEITSEAIAAIKSEPGVVAVDPFISQQATYRDNLINIGAGDFEVLLEHGRLLFKSPKDADSQLRQAIGEDSVVISESFSLRYEKQPGDTVELPTMAGLHPFKVAAVYYDYSSNRGTAVMDRTTYARHFNRAGPASLSIYLRQGASEDEVKESLTRKVGRQFQLVFTTNASVRREVIRIFDSTFSITYALELIAIAVAGLGVISTLLTLILERRGEIAVLGFLGATRDQVRRMIVIEAVMIGGVSQGVGMLIGLMLSFVLIYVINVQSFGWTIQFHLPWTFLAQSTALILVATAVAGLYPASRAASIKEGVGGRGSGFRVNGLWLVFAAGCVLLFGLSITAKQDVRGPRVNGEGWREAEPGYNLAFPRDHASHPDYRIEWWYYTGNIETKTGKRFGYQLTFFRTGIVRETAISSRWAVRDLYMTHFAVSDIENKKFYSFERLNRAGIGWAGAETSSYRVWNEDWEARLDGGDHLLRASEESFQIDLRLTPAKPEIVHGMNGISQKGPSEGNASHYYSITRFQTAGRIVVDGESFDVAGLSWMDHEFGTSFLESNQVGWDWFSIQLEDGRELMLFQIRREDGSRDARSSGTLIDSTGRATHIGFDEFALAPGDKWRSAASGAAYPTTWTIELPGQDTRLGIRAAFEDQELRTDESTGVTYWEGSIEVEGTSGGRQLRGRGYLEMTGYSGQNMGAIIGQP